MGGGFCEKHGPYDPPHTSCPFCAQEDAQRRAFGRPPYSVPEMTRPAGKKPDPGPERDPAPPESDQEDAPEFDQEDVPEFVRRTVDSVGDEDGDWEPEVELDQAADSAPPTQEDKTQVAPGHYVVKAEGEVEEPSWIEQVPEPIGWLVVKWPIERRGEVLRVQPNQIIGRQGDIRWNDARLSRQHARFTFEHAEVGPDPSPVFHIWPFGTRNPVAVNGQLIRGATPIRENDEIHLGDTLFVFKTLLD